MPAQASAPDEATVTQRLLSMQYVDGYKEGTLWDNSNHSYNWYNVLDNYSTYTAYGCMAFALAMSDAAFGSSLHARTVSPVSYASVRAGDILRIDGDTHSVIVLQKTADGVQIAEGNMSINGGAGQVHWGRILSSSQVASANYMITRYPAGSASSFTQAQPEPTPEQPQPQAQVGSDPAKGADVQSDETVEEPAAAADVPAADPADVPDSSKQAAPDSLDPGAQSGATPEPSASPSPKPTRSPTPTPTKKPTPKPTAVQQATKSDSTPTPDGVAQKTRSEPGTSQTGPDRYTSAQLLVLLFVCAVGCACSVLTQVFKRR